MVCYTDGVLCLYNHHLQVFTICFMKRQLMVNSYSSCGFLLSFIFSTCVVVVVNVTFLTCDLIKCTVISSKTYRHPVKLDTLSPYFYFFNLMGYFTIYYNQFDFEKKKISNNFLFSILTLKLSKPNTVACHVMLTASVGP